MKQHTHVVIRCWLCGSLRDLLRWCGADAATGVRARLGEVVRRLSPKTGLVPVPFGAKPHASLLRQIFFTSGS